MFGCLNATALPRLWSLLHTPTARATLWKPSLHRKRATLHQRAQQPKSSDLNCIPLAQGAGAGPLPDSGTGTVLSSQANFYRVRLDDEHAGGGVTSGVRAARRTPWFQARPTSAMYWLSTYQVGAG